MTTIVAPPSNASKWQMGFNLTFKGLNSVICSSWRETREYCIVINYNYVEMVVSSNNSNKTWGR
jgi:hypothetical protein